MKFVRKTAQQSGRLVLVEFQAEFELANGSIRRPDSLHAVSAEIMSSVLHVLFRVAQCSERLSNLRMRFRRRCSRAGRKRLCLGDCRSIGLVRRGGRRGHEGKYEKQ